MRNIKFLAIALMLALTAMVYAAGGQQTDVKEKAASCCANCNDSCCMKGQKSGDAKTAHESCDMSKSGKSCCGAKADCCKAGADCCKAGAECCKKGESCCGQNHMTNDKQGKAQACDMKGGEGCCGADCACCKGGSCGKEKTAKQ
ncbi:MAG TPA: hypothetical protein VKB86_01875 [Pyrinomonadaceae bacterium]|nr:hypothetical protein [Pyrinomonadaceae bacterium]